MNRRERSIAAARAAPEGAEAQVADVEARVLRWRCRRGMKELDVLLERYAVGVLPRADADERRLLGRLLEHPDPQLASYFLGGERPADPSLAALVTRIRTSCMIDAT